jgi:putative nucleotidyltransferase-like protein
VREAGLAEAWGGTPGQRNAWPTPAQEQLLRAALLSDERALEAWRAIRTQLGLDVDGRATPALDAAARGVLPALYRNLLELGLEDPLLAALRSAHQSTWINNQRLITRVLPALRALEGAGIRTMVIKGAALIARGRFDGGLRAITDVDVVIPSEQLGRAIDVLAEIDFLPVGGVPAWYVRDYAGRFVPSHAFAGAENAQIDLHWHVLHASCQQDADEDFWARAEPARLGDAPTAVLSPGDELLLAVLHGLRWSERPTYRWALDATQLARGEHGPIDFERVLAQARLRRASAAVHAGLAYLRRVLDAPIPPTLLRGLRRAPRLERLGLRAELNDPRARGPFARALVLHQQHACRALALGRRATPREHVRLAREQLGLGRWRELRFALRGGTPGPGRPASTVAASLGGAPGEGPAPTIELEEPIELGDPEVARRCVRYGTWLPEDGTCWTAGPQARLSLALTRAAPGPLLLVVWLGAYLPPERPQHRQRLSVVVNEEAVGAVRLDAQRSRLDGEAFVVPRSALSSVAGRLGLELTLDTPDALSPAQAGAAPDDRLLGVSINRLVLRGALDYEVGQRLGFGERSGDERFLAGGWSRAEQDGRWTSAERASLLLRLSERPATVDVEVHAIPFLVQRRRALDVGVLANGRRIGAFSFRHPAEPAQTQRVPLPHDAVGADGELLLTLCIDRPSSPHAHGLSDDRRTLGLFVSELALVPRAAGRLL